MELAALMDRRLQLAGDVAWAKQASGARVRDTVREQAVLDRFCRLARERGLDEAGMREFAEAQIRASRLLQQIRIDEWSSGQPLPSGAPPRLQKDIRPQLDLLTTEMVEAWAAWTRVSRAARFRAADQAAVRHHLQSAGYPEPVAAAAAGLPEAPETTPAPK